MPHQDGLVDFCFSEPAGLLRGKKHFDSYLFATPLSHPDFPIATFSNLFHHLNLFCYGSLNLKNAKTHSENSLCRYFLHLSPSFFVSSLHSKPDGTGSMQPLKNAFQQKLCHTDAPHFAPRYSTTVVIPVPVKNPIPIPKPYVLNTFKTQDWDSRRAQSSSKTPISTKDQSSTKTTVSIFLSPSLKTLCLVISKYNLVLGTTAIAYTVRIHVPTFILINFNNFIGIESKN